MLSPGEHQKNINSAYAGCYMDLSILLMENGGYWEIDKDDTKYIVMRDWFGSPIIHKLKFENGIIYFKSALYGSPKQPLVYTENSPWMELRAKDSFVIFDALYDKLVGEEQA